MPDNITTESEVLQLPFKVTKLDEDGLVAISRNFKAIEDILSAMQSYMNKTGYAAINNANNLFDSIIMVGLDADLPGVNETNGRRFYWAYDSQKLYLLKEKVVE